MANVAYQDDQWLMCVTEALGFDDLEIYFERRDEPSYKVQTDRLSVRSINWNPENAVGVIL